MKKRDLTKLALIGITIGLCGGPVEADDLTTVASISEQAFTAGCGQQQPGQPNQYPQQQPMEQNGNANPQGNAQPSKTSYPQNVSSQINRNNKGQVADAGDSNQDGPCGATPPAPGAPNNMPKSAK
jgi:hypothetical protein